MADKVDLYNTSYGNYATEVYSAVRKETYGEDFGQTSWATAKEFREIFRRLELKSASSVLEIGCGSGGCALFLAETLGCRVTGLDLNEDGIRAATELAAAKGLGSLAKFEHRDVSHALAFPDNTFDAAYSNDAMCHIAGRLAVLKELRRVLKPGGRIFYSDALVISGMVSGEELAARSSIGFYLFVPSGENEKLIEAAGFRLLRADDATEEAATISKRWHDARIKHRTALIEVEGETNFLGLQRFLWCVYTLTKERRLSRFLYLAEK
jgi:SAM-dependent methyltransferase